MTSGGDGSSSGPGRAWWLGLLLAGSVLAVPMAVDAHGIPAAVAKVLLELLLVLALAGAIRTMPAQERLPWVLLASSALVWLVLYIVELLRETTGCCQDWQAGMDLIWVSTYLPQALAVHAMMRLRRLPTPVVRDIQLDVLVVTTAATLGVWLIIVQPELDSGASLRDSLLPLLYPLGDLVVFSLAMTVLLVPGTSGPAAVLLITSFGATLPLDFLYRFLVVEVPQFDADRLFAGFLLLNALLGAAALHPSRSRLIAPAVAVQHLRRWRIAVLALSLGAVSMANALTAQTGPALIPGLTASLVVTTTVVLRFHRMAQAQERATLALRELAERDRLTGAANRELLSRRLPDFVTRPPGLLVYIDLDGFKKLNDTHGHHTGDFVLCAITQRLSKVVRESDTIARVGGDEFVVLLNDCGAAEAPTVAQRIFEDMCAPITDGTLTVQVGASVGVVVLQHPLEVHDGPVLAEDLMRSADAAMYDVKRRGGGFHLVYYGDQPVQA